MEMHALAATAAPDDPDTPSAPAAAEPCVEASRSTAGPLRPRYVLVEDIEHFAETGVLRRILVIQWVR